MARIRSLKPEWGASESLSAVSVEAHLLSAALLTYADDEGYFKANPELVRAGTLPLRNLETPVSQLISELESIGYIELANGTDGRRYGRISNFLAHQRINRPTPSKLKLIAGFSDGSMSEQGSAMDGSGTGNREVEQGSGRGKSATDDLPELPPELRTDGFCAAFRDWLRYKSERGERYQPTGLQQQLAMLAKRGATEATEALRLAMAQNWKGAAPPDAIERYRAKAGRTIPGQQSDFAAAVAAKVRPLDYGEAKP